MTTTEALDRIMATDPRGTLAYLAGLAYGALRFAGNIDLTLELIATKDPDIANLIRSIGAIA